MDSLNPPKKKHPIHYFLSVPMVHLSMMGLSTQFIISVSSRGPIMSTSTCPSLTMSTCPCPYVHVLSCPYVYVSMSMSYHVHMSMSICRHVLSCPYVYHVHMSTSASVFYMPHVEHILRKEDKAFAIGSSSLGIRC